MFSNSKKYQKGVSLYLAVMIMSLILGAAFGVNALLQNQLREIRSIGYSMFALGAADAGIERIFYDAQKGIDVLAECPVSAPCVFELPNGAQYVITVTGPGPNCPAEAYCAKSVGSFESAQRAIRIAR